MARTGRPKSENSKDIRLNLRVDESDNGKLEEICKMTGTSKTESIRSAIRKYYEFLKKGK